MFMLFCSLMQTREHNQSFHRHKQTSHTVIIFVCKIIIIIDGRYYKAVLFFWLTHSVNLLILLQSSFHKWNIMYIYIYKNMQLYKNIYLNVCYIYVIYLGWGGHYLFFLISSLPAKEKMVKTITKHLCNIQCAFMSLPAQTASIMLLNMGQSLITWTPVRGISSRGHDTGKSLFPFQFILKINHLSKLNVRGWLEFTWTAN